jgi:hypothetical protein
MRGALLGLFALATLACGGNAPLTSNGGGNAGTGGAMGGQGGSPGSPGAAGATATGGAGTGGQNGPGITMCGTATLPSGQCAQYAYKPLGDVTAACVCQDDAPCVCGGTCANLLLDVDNCGMCGNRCGPTSACAAGLCGPVSTIAVPAQSGCTSIDVAISGTRLYWTDAGHGVVQSLLIGGSGKTTYATGEAAPARIAVVGSSVFWLDKGTVIRKAGANLAVTTVAEAAAPVGGFVVSPDGATVYFSSDTMIYSVPAAGGVPVVVAREVSGQPGGLALAGNTLAFPTGLNGDVDRVTLVDGQVVSCGLGDGEGNLIQIECARLARGQGELFLDTILARPDQVIWFNGANLNIETGSEAGNYYLLATTANDAGTGMAMNDTTVYFSEGAPNAPGAGVIYKAPIAKAPIATQQTAVPIARGQDGPRSLAVGATKVFWSTSDCSIESTGL